MPISRPNQKLTQQHNPPDRRLELVFPVVIKLSHYNRKTDTTAQLYCTLSTYVTPKTISLQNQKTKPISRQNQKLTQQHNPPDRRLELFFSGRNKTFLPQQKTTVGYSNYIVVCTTKTYFPPEPKTDTTAQLGKKFLQPT
jgi:hypothetical protein